MHRIAASTVSGCDHETMTHVPRDTHVTKQRMAMRSNFPWSDFKKIGTPELSSSSYTSTALSPKNFEKRAHPIVAARFLVVSIIFRRVCNFWPVSVLRNPFLLEKFLFPILSPFSKNRKHVNFSKSHYFTSIVTS